MSNLNNLYEFILVAQNSRKYSANTASSYKTALKYFEAELNDDEKNSIELINKNFDSIYRAVFNKNKSKMSIASLEVYKRRVRNLLNDYNKYGDDPAKMSSWSRPIKQIKTSKSKNLKNKDELDTSSRESNEYQGQNVRFELPLRPNIKAIVVTPKDMTAEEAEKIKNYIEYLKSNIALVTKEPVSASKDE